MEYLPQVIEQDAEYLQHLRSLVHGRRTLEKRGYIFDQLTEAELERKKRCGRCYKALAKTRLRPERVTKNSGRITQRGGGREQAVGENEALVLASSDPSLESGGVSLRSPGPDMSITSPMADDPSLSLNLEGSNRTPRTIHKPCKYHPGQVLARKWTCCQGPPMAKPCCADEDHTPIAYGPTDLRDNWRFYATPPAWEGSSFSSNGIQSRAAAVAIDCEMGVTEAGESELIRVSVVDYFTGATLLDSLVWPDMRMQHYNTRFSGVTRQAMMEAKRKRTCIFGRRNARKAIWRLVGPDTVVVGHAVNSDLTSLRWIHHTIVDTLCIEEAISRQERMKAEAVAEAEAEARLEAAEEACEDEAPEEAVKINHVPRGLSLKSLTQERLSREIQIKGQGHDSVEDALASRDLLHWHVREALEAQRPVENIIW